MARAWDAIVDMPSEGKDVSIWSSWSTIMGALDLMPWRDDDLCWFVLDAVPAWPEVLDVKEDLAGALSVEAF